ncbi:uncharacterized protein OCT59_007014 [Rhizophagus irregularis]|uniref:uncharacterized protein n=1 Tax=Rhizophagus irregularis TaxID=588596 RepID=UPI003320A926|nr:hypothetical protein OCT59_007014 [Rhizophagus irregularis]
MASLNIIGYLLYNLNKIIPTLIIAYIFKYYLSWYTRENPIPGPIPLPLIGNLHQIGKDLGKEAIKLQKKYGDIFEVMLGPSRVIFISRAELMEKICSPALKNNVFAYRSLPNAGLDEMGLSKSEIFSAGADTTRNSLCFIIYYILKYPEVKDKLIKEYESIYGDLTKKPNITNESLDKLVYTEAVISEVARLKPAVPVFLRATSLDTEIGGYKIKKVDPDSPLKSEFKSVEHCNELEIYVKERE